MQCSGHGRPGWIRYLNFMRNLSAVARVRVFFLVTQAKHNRSCTQAQNCKGTAIQALERGELAPTTLTRSQLPHAYIRHTTRACRCRAAEAPPEPTTPRACVWAVASRSGIFLVKWGNSPHTFGFWQRQLGVNAKCACKTHDRIAKTLI